MGEELLALLPEHLILALEFAVFLSELGILLLERGDLGLCSLRAGFRGVLVAEERGAIGSKLFIFFGCRSAPGGLSR